MRKAHSVEEVLKESDYVSLHAPLLDVTRHMINAERLKLLKHSAVLLNFARDELVDNAAVPETVSARPAATTTSGAE